MTQKKLRRMRSLFMSKGPDLAPMTVEDIQEHLDKYRNLLEETWDLLADFEFDAYNRQVTNNTYDLITAAIGETRRKAGKYLKIREKLMVMQESVKQGATITSGHILMAILDSTEEGKKDV
jgi:hypothetical protein